MKTEEIEVRGLGSTVDRITRIMIGLAEARDLIEGLRRAIRSAERTGGTYWAAAQRGRERLEIGVHG